MVMGCKYGSMVPNIKVIGTITEHKVKGSFGMRMVICLKVIL